MMSLPEMKGLGLLKSNFRPTSHRLARPVTHISSISNQPPAAKVVQALTRFPNAGKQAALRLRTANPPRCVRVDSWAEQITNIRNRCIGPVDHPQFRFFDTRSHFSKRGSEVEPSLLVSVRRSRT